MLNVVCVAILMFCFNISCSCSERVAMPRDGYFSPHDLCEVEIARVEKQYGIPHRLLMAISTVESGRVTGSSRRKRPWAWTVCANGRGYYFSTKSAAIASVKKLMGRGIRNIDVGCMQVNLFHHSKAFRDLEEAFTPKNNVDYGAKFFVELKKCYKSWTNAVGYYHSKAEKFFKPYCSHVYAAWTKTRQCTINNSKAVQLASAANARSNISFLPSYYSSFDRRISNKLHQLGKKTISKKAPKFCY